MAREKVFAENPDLADEIEVKLRQALGMIPTEAEAAEAPPEAVAAD